MKKITLLFCLLMGTYGFSQELITNGDFQTGPPAAPWYSGGDNNPIEVIDEGGGNFVFQANVTSVTDVWRVNLSQVVALQDNTSYEVSFEANTDNATGTRPLNVALGQAGPNFAATVPQVATLTSTRQTFTYTITTNFDTANSGSTTPGSRLIFDMGDAVGFVFIDNVSLTEAAPDPCSNGVQDGDETGIDCGGSCPNACPMPPTVAAPTPPARDANAVVALYSNAYTQSSNWGQIDVFGGATLTDIMVAGDDTYELTGAPGEGYQYNYFAAPGTSEDLSAMTHYHVDIWVDGTVAGGEVFTVQALNYDAMDVLESNNFYQAPITATGQWISVDVPISSFANASGNTNYDNIKLLQIILQGPQFGPVYFDNLYFHNNTTLSSDEFSTTEFKVFPNPSTDSWNVTSSSTINNIELFNVLGKNVLSVDPNSTAYTIEASSLTSGLYFARISSENGSQTIKLIKE